MSEFNLATLIARPVDKAARAVGKAQPVAKLLNNNTTILYNNTTILFGRPNIDSPNIFGKPHLLLPLQT